VRYQRNSAETAKFLKSSQVRLPLTLVAGRALNRARVNVRKVSGDTARTGRLVHKSNGGVKHDRVQVSVEFGGEILGLQFGNKRFKPSRPLTRALVD